MALGWFPNRRTAMSCVPPLISVLLPVYNAERYIAQAVESVLGQTLEDFEFLIIDDGSTDGTLEILRRYERRDSRIRLWSRPNEGLAETLNELIDASSGEFLARMDADDVSRPGRFARQVAYLRGHPETVLVGSRIRLIDLDGDPLCEWCTEEEHEALEGVFLRGKRHTTIAHPSIMMRREAVLKVGKYRDLRLLEEVDLYLRLGEIGRLANLPEVLLEYRIHDGNMSRAALRDKGIDREFRKLLQEVRRRRGLPEPNEERLPDLGLSRDSSEPNGEAEHAFVQPADLDPLEERVGWAWWALGSGHKATARKHARWVFVHAPMALRSWKLMYCVLRGH